jgi:GTPase SAR1 family protein
VASSGGNQVYKAFILGSSGVGKTALTQQFMTSEYMGAFDTSTGKLFPSFTSFDNLLTGN